MLASENEYFSFPHDPMMWWGSCVLWNEMNADEDHFDKEEKGRKKKKWMKKCFKRRKKKLEVWKIMAVVGKSGLVWGLSLSRVI